MSNECCSKAKKDKSVMIFACASGANVGQCAHAAAVKLHKAGIGKLYTLGGVCAHLKPMVRQTTEADLRVAIDGCEMFCVRKALEHADIAVDHHIVLTELGMKRSYELPLREDEVQQAFDAVNAAIGTC